MATNKSPLISAEHRGEIAILRIGTQLLVDGDIVTRFYDEVIEAIGECSHVVFDMAQLRHLSSNLLSKFILILRKSQKRGGRVVFCHASPAVREHFRTSNLDRLFQFASTLEEALASLSWTLGIRCPIADCAGDGLCHEASITDRGGELCCRSCGCKFRVAPFRLSPGGEARVAVSRFEIPTYEQEWIRAELGAIVHLDILGRLDLFAAEALVDAWRSLPGPRRALLDLRAATELSEPGLRLFEEHVRVDTSIDRVVVLVDPDRSDRTRAVFSDVRITTTQDEAMSVLRGSPESEETPAPLFVSARTVERSAEQS
jgi:anti-anti-sigma factor